ncbi:DUF2809 domain-containing protein, partial [Sphingopyxis sp. JAI128]|uniref:DUF2809 domain-containing protein n=1 Tax=Sphingopyxis sp. JAI128 TaxID=2723066 RepID=UPI00161BE0ED
MPALTWRPRYALAALLLFLIEVAIALWVRDRFVRPYLGDVLAVILVYLALRAVTTSRVAPAALAAFFVGLLVEIGQVVDLLALLGLADQGILRVVLGRVDKRDSQSGLRLIQDCFLRSSHGSRGFVG